MIKFNKKGISTIVATVLIVLITVAAVTILWAAVSPLIDQNLGSSTACFEAQNKLKIDSDKTYTFYNNTDTTDKWCCINDGAAACTAATANVGTWRSCDATYNLVKLVDAELSVRVEREANSDTIKGFQVYVEDAGETITAELIESTLPTQNGAAVYNFAVDATADLTGPVTVSIAPQIMSEGELMACEPSTAMTITKTP